MNQEDSTLVRTIEESLSRVWGSKIALEKCRPFKKKRILRCSPSLAPREIPRDFLVKMPRLKKGEEYGSSTDAPETGTWRFRNELASLELLGRISGQTRLAPRLLGVDHESGLFAYEFLSGTRTFRDLFRGGTGEIMEKALGAYSRTMAELHGRSVGLRAEWVEIRGGPDGSPDASMGQIEHRLHRWYGRCYDIFLRGANR